MGLKIFLLIFLFFLFPVCFLLFPIFSPSFFFIFSLTIGRKNSKSLSGLTFHLRDLSIITQFCFLCKCFFNFFYFSKDVHSKNNSNAKSIYNLCNYFFKYLTYYFFFFIYDHRVSDLVHNIRKKRFCEYEKNSNYIEFLRAEVIPLFYLAIRYFSTINLKF